jgi:hypothetical protein
MQRLASLLLALVLTVVLPCAGGGIIRGWYENHEEEQQRRLKAPAPTSGKGAPAPAPSSPSAPKAMPTPPYPYTFHNSKKNLTCPNAYSTAFHTVIKQGYKTQFCKVNSECVNFPTTDGLPCCLWPQCICGANTPNAPTVSCVTPLDEFLSGSG